jgi:hypothetical protein
MRILLAGVALLAVAACSSAPDPLGPRVDAPKPGPYMSSAEIKDTLGGKTGTGPISGSHITYSMYMAPDGTAQAKLPSGVDQGRWWVTGDDQLCFQWQIYRGGQQYCQHVYKDPAGYRLADTTSVELLAFANGKTF